MRAAAGELEQLHEALVSGNSRGDGGGVGGGFVVMLQGAFL